MSAAAKGTGSGGAMIRRGSGRQQARRPFLWATRALIEEALMAPAGVVGVCSASRVRCGFCFLFCPFFRCRQDRCYSSRLRYLCRLLIRRRDSYFVCVHAARTPSGVSHPRRTTARELEWVDVCAPCGTRYCKFLACLEREWWDALRWERSVLDGRSSTRRRERG